MISTDAWIIENLNSLESCTDDMKLWISKLDSDYFSANNVKEAIISLIEAKHSIRNAISQLELATLRPDRAT